MMRINQLVGRRFTGDQHAEPAEGINTVITPDYAGRHSLAADAMEAVAAGDVIAFDGFFGSLMHELDQRFGAIEPADLFGLRLEINLPARLKPRADHVLDDFVLRINRHASA